LNPSFEHAAPFRLIRLHSRRTLRDQARYHTGINGWRAREEWAGLRHSESRRLEMHDPHTAEDEDNTDDLNHPDRFVQDED